MKTEQIKSKKCLLIVCLVIFSMRLSAQGRLDGDWTIVDREVITGPDYINGIPSQINIRQKDKLISLERISVIPNNRQDTLLEQLPMYIDTVLVEEGSSQRQEQLNWFNKETGFQREIQFVTEGKSQTRPMVRTEIWRLSADGKKLTLLRGEQAVADPSTKWLIEGEYMQRQAGEVWGVAFSEPDNWNELLQMAQQQNKYIFIDCFATWCGPCKKMDREVYTSKKLGDQMNEQFISVKLQMDQTARDDDFVKSWYNKAEEMKKAYGVNAYPTYLFFSPSGELVHKGIGYKTAGDFITLAEAAVTPFHQYYTLQRAYNAGELSKPEQLKELALLAHSFKDSKLGTEVADRYIGEMGVSILDTEGGLDFVQQFSQSAIAQKIAQEYINGLSEEALYNQENLGFLIRMTLSSDTRGFEILYEHPQKVDSFFVGNPSRSRVDYIIRKEEVDPYIWDNNKPVSREPNWVKLERNIQKKYSGEFSKRIIAEVKPIWYRAKGDWKNYCRSVVDRVEALGLSASMFSLDQVYNNTAWDIFEHGVEKSVLEKALTWSDSALAISRREKPADIFNLFCQQDTKANLLYKLGREKEAIALMEEVEARYQLERERGGAKRDPASSYKKTIDKMRAGEPTWGL